MKIFFKVFGFFKKFFSIFNDFGWKCICAFSFYFRPNFLKNLQMFLKFNGILNLLFFYHRIRIYCFKKKHRFRAPYLPNMCISVVWYGAFSIYYRTTKMLFKKFLRRDRRHINSYLKTINLSFSAGIMSSIFDNLNATLSIKKTGKIREQFVFHRRNINHG